MAEREAVSSNGCGTGSPEGVGAGAADTHVLEAYLSLAEPRLVLDVRPDSAFHPAHLVGAYHISPVTELKSRYSYLPPRDVGFLVIAELVQLDQVLAAFVSITAAKLVFLADSSHTSSAQASFASAPSCIVDQTLFFAAARSLGLVRTSTSHQDRLVHGGSDVPLLLFRPSPAVRRSVLQLEASRSTHTLRVLDLGCGAARDLAWILHATRTRLPSDGQASVTTTTAPVWTGVGIDNWKAALTRAQQLMDDLWLSPSHSAALAPELAPQCEKLLWAKCNEQGYIEPLTGTGKGKSVRDSSQGLQLLKECTRLGLQALLPPSLLIEDIPGVDSQPLFDLVLCVRFHPRPLLPRLAGIVRPGGCILLSHFVTLSDIERKTAAKSYPHATLDYDSPPPEGRIQPNEVENLIEAWNRSALSRNTWTVAETRLEPIEDGRIIKSVVLEKQAA